MQVARTGVYIEFQEWNVLRECNIINNIVLHFIIFTESQGWIQGEANVGHFIIQQEKGTFLKERKKW